MMISGILIFSIAVIMVSFLVSKHGDHDRGKLSTMITLIAWGSMIFGLFIARLAP